MAAAKKKVTKKKVTKKKAVRKKAARKKITKKKAVTGVHRPASIEDYFDAETGELLNSKHEIFAQMWVQTFDRDKACAAAGYEVDGERGSYWSSRSVLRREEVQTRVRAILKERVKDMAITEEFVVLNLLDVFNKGISEKPLFDKEGDLVGYEYNDLRAALNAMEKLGQNLGMFQKQDKGPSQNITLNLNYGPAEPEAPKLTRQPIKGEAKRLN